MKPTAKWIHPLADYGQKIPPLFVCHPTSAIKTATVSPCGRGGLTWIMIFCQSEFPGSFSLDTFRKVEIDRNS